MKLVLDLPEVFREHFQFDKFQDSFMRICGDIKEISLSHSKPNSDSLGLSGNYERELVDVLKTAFGKAVDLEEITVIKLPHAEEQTIIFSSNTALSFNELWLDDNHAKKIMIETVKTLFEKVNAKANEQVDENGKVFTVANVPFPTAGNWRDD